MQDPGDSQGRGCPQRPRSRFSPSLLRGCLCTLGAACAQDCVRVRLSPQLCAPQSDPLSPLVEGCAQRVGGRLYLGPASKPLASQCRPLSWGTDSLSGHGASTFPRPGPADPAGAGKQGLSAHHLLAGPRRMEGDTGSCLPVLLSLRLWVASLLLQRGNRPRDKAAIPAGLGDGAELGKAGGQRCPAAQAPGCCGSGPECGARREPPGELGDLCPLPPRWPQDIELVTECLKSQVFVSDENPASQCFPEPWETCTTRHRALGMALLTPPRLHQHRAAGPASPGWGVSSG